MNVLVTALMAAAMMTGREITANEAFGDGWQARWKMQTPSRWAVVREGRRSILRMTEPGVPPEKIRRPGEIAIWTANDWGEVEMTANVRCDQIESNTARDAILILGYQDDTHYYYVHLAGRSDAVHNAIMLVNGKERERIDRFDPAHLNPVTLTDRKFHKVRVVRRPVSGEIQVYFDDGANPVMQAVDRTLTHGMLGVGSFDDTASFHSLVARGSRVVAANARP
jgi:hypothetical protein